MITSSKILGYLPLPAKLDEISDSILVLHKQPFLIDLMAKADSTNSISFPFQARMANEINFIPVPLVYGWYMDYMVNIENLDFYIDF